MTVAMLRMQLLVEQRIFWRNRSTTFFTFVLPLAMLAALAASDDPVEHVPLVAALGILSISFQGLAIQIAMHRDQGVLKRVMASPLPPSLLIAGKLLSTMLVVSLELAVIVAIGVAAFGAPVPAEPVLLVAFVLLGTATFAALAFAVASMVPTSDSAPAIVNGAYLALIMATILLHQLDGVPAALRLLGSALPLTHLLLPIQHAWIGTEPVDLRSAAVLLAWALAASWWAVRRFRWEPVEER